MFTSASFLLYFVCCSTRNGVAKSVFLLFSQFLLEKKKSSAIDLVSGDNFPTCSFLQHPVQLISHPLAKTLRLIVCPVSGIASRQATFQKKLQISLCHLGEQVPKNNIPPTFKSGWTFVVKGRLLVIHQQ